jgi:hypothetical protein
LATVKKKARGKRQEARGKSEERGASLFLPCCLIPVAKCLLSIAARFFVVIRRSLYVKTASGRMLDVPGSSVKPKQDRIPEYRIP